MVEFIAMVLTGIEGIIQWDLKDSSMLNIINHLYSIVYCASL